MSVSHHRASDIHRDWLKTAIRYYCFPNAKMSPEAWQYVVDGMEPGTYRRPFRKHTVKLTEDVRVDSFLLQYNPIHNDDVPMNQKFQGELHFDRPIVALILQKDLLDSSDMQLALPATDFRKIFRRGINDADVITLSADRRVLHVALNVKNGVDQIRVLVASDNNSNSQ